MEAAQLTQTQVWPAWRRIIFRFFFIYLLLNISPWTWLDSIPGISYLDDIYGKVMDWAVYFGNDHFFHVRKVLVPPEWERRLPRLCVGVKYGFSQPCCVWLRIIWEFVSTPKIAGRTHRLNYWLCLFTRYYISMIAFIYGIEKLFALQMYFPNLSQLATPLGDFLPMRFSWLFIGYSTPYQVFSGVMETMVGLLLLYRRTTTLGILMGTAVFLNVMMLNLCYDIPVKIFSMQIVLMCLFLLVNEFDRIVCFFVLNRPAAACNIYDFHFKKRWMRITRVILKIAFIMIAVGWQFKSMIEYYKSSHTDTAIKPVPTGIYDVAVFAINKDTLPLSVNDSLRWRDVIFDNFGSGSIRTDYCRIN